MASAIGVPVAIFASRNRLANVYEPYYAESLAIDSDLPRMPGSGEQWPRRPPEQFVLNPSDILKTSKAATRTPSPVE